MSKAIHSLMSKEAREALNHQVKHWFETELDIDLGQFEADAAVDFFIEQLTPTIHNRAIQAALGLLQEHHARIEDDLYALEQAER